MKMLALPLPLDYTCFNTGKEGISMRTELNLLRNRMAHYGVDAYIIPTDDFHGSEYVGDYFRCREWVSGFTGSAGTLVVTGDWAGLWTDGRYFLQAADQLRDSGIHLMKMGEPGVPTKEAWLKEHLKADAVLGFDGRTMTSAGGKALEGLGFPIFWEKDLVGEIWEDRPTISTAPAWELDVAYTGRTRKDKLEALIRDVKEQGCQSHILTSLDDICWLLNVRGDDVTCCPVVLGYVIVTGEQVTWYVDGAKLSPELSSAILADGVVLKDYFAIYEDVKALTGKVLLSPQVVNYAIIKGLSAQIREGANPTTLPKAVKTDAEVENETIAHIKDGAALTRFMKWIKENAGKREITEISAAEQLEVFRRQQENYLGPSFEPIMGYAHHGAIVHYSATEDSDIPLKAESFLLSDTGGHYLEGSTDVTRTFALGPVSQEMKLHYTLVLKGHLNLSAAKFKQGCGGVSLDYIARAPFWERGLDYNHGTGHGVGYLLSVHEGPQNIRYNPVGNSAKLQPGMITSNEPGIYLEGKYGVRIENLTVCEKFRETEYGTFLCFRDLTMCPYDLDAVELSLLTDREKQLMNAYHEKVYTTLAPLYNEEERAWLKNATRAV